MTDTIPGGPPAPPLLSPDGRWLWTGTEWITAPSTNADETEPVVADSPRTIAPEGDSILPERGRRRAPASRSRGLIAAGVAVPVVVIAAIVGIVHGGSGASHTISGTFKSYGAMPLDRNQGNGEGVPCRVQGVDVAAGTSVTVTNHSGKELGLGSLAGGVEDATMNDCIFTFTLKVPDTDFYNIQVGSGNAVSFSRSELASSGWQPGISNTG